MDIIFQARFPDLILPSPYLLYPRPIFIINEYKALGAVLDFFTSDEYFSENSETQDSECRCKFLRHVVGEFIRQYLDSSFPLWTFNWPSERTSKRHKRDMISMIDLEVDLWVKTLRMVANLHSMRAFSELLRNEPHYTFYFRNIIEESKLVTLYWYRVSRQNGATKIVRIMQSGNRKLKNCENPFSYESEPCTYETIKKAILKADQDDFFRKEVYYPVVRARERIVTSMKKTKAHIHINGVTQRSGRRKENDSA